MKIFTKTAWIEYEHGPNVLPFRRALAAAAQAAVQAQIDRGTSREDEIKRLLVGYEKDIDKLHRVVAALRQEQFLIEVRRG